ncbi:MAG TPA: phosphoenolpyruvate--protein phosphotransferase [Kiritimatiellia bacterium]|nr:phosphoenolpyruvate--protein phosphotransferase [Kiritimatiellia bacterium]
MRKDNVDLICSIGEIAGLFEKSPSLEDFLQTVVSIVAHHMRAAVCSVYLYEEDTQELVLTATQGLNIKEKSQIRLKLGEGLTGTALKELRPIREGAGNNNPNFKFIPGISEEKYQAFLAVPILRGLSRVGVMVLQDPVVDYFDENDTKALQAIAAQLATTIENAKLLMTLHRIKSEPPKDVVKPAQDVRELKFIKGKSGARGHAFGKPTILGGMKDQFVIEEGSQAFSCTLEDFQRSLQRTEQQLEELQVVMEERLADVASLIFSAHLLIVKDPKFSGSMIEYIRNGESPPQAILRVINQYIKLFSSSKNPRLQEKVQDVKDLGRRLLQNLRTDEEAPVDYDGHIVVAGELLPSDVLKLSAQRAEGIIQVGGAVASHIAILARSLNIPMVVADDNRLFSLNPDVHVMIDGDQGNIYIDPDDAVRKSFENFLTGQTELESRAAKVLGETWTQDKVRIRLMANINMLNELKTANLMKAEGVGLYRSEFPFIVRNNFPSEEEQYRVYRVILEEMDQREVVFRTLDVGGDKMLSYFPNVSESNPFLGLRAIRFSFRYKNIFIQQLRALLRAGADRNLKIMFPMISSVDDFVQARQVVNECIEQLRNEDISCHEHPKLGAMIELPAAVEVVGELAGEADFLSIGGNDLVQYMLAVDRTNQQISDLYVSHHPAVLRALKRIACACSDNKSSLSFCGEMATDTKMLKFLVGIGIRQFSVEPRMIPLVQAALSAMNTGECRSWADSLLAMGKISDVDAAMKNG